jgi:hypothetical protein
VWPQCFVGCAAAEDGVDIDDHRAHRVGEASSHWHGSASEKDRSSRDQENGRACDVASISAAAPSASSVAAATPSMTGSSCGEGYVRIDSVLPASHRQSVCRAINDAGHSWVTLGDSRAGGQTVVHRRRLGKKDNIIKGKLVPPSRFERETPRSTI